VYANEAGPEGQTKVGYVGILFPLDYDSEEFFVAEWKEMKGPQKQGD